MVTTLEQPILKADTHTLELSPALKRLADRYFSDGEFRLNLHRDPYGTLAADETGLTHLEKATVLSYLSSPLLALVTQKLVAKPDETELSYLLYPFMANSWGSEH